MFTVPGSTTAHSSIPLRERLDGAEPRLRSHLARGVGGSCEGQSGVDDRVHLRADALDDRGVEVGIVLLPPGGLIVGVDVDDRGTGLHAGDALGDDLADRNRDARLARARPGAVQRDSSQTLRFRVFSDASVVVIALDDSGAVASPPSVGERRSEGAARRSDAGEARGPRSITKVAELQGNVADGLAQQLDRRLKVVLLAPETRTAGPGSRPGPSSCCP